MRVRALLFFMPVLFVYPISATVTVTSPQAGQTVNSPVSFQASATTNTCSSGVASMGVYVDNVLTYVVNGASLSTSISIAPGSHHTVVEEWDHCGGATYTSVDLTIAGVAVKSPAPGSPVTTSVTYTATAATTCSKGVAAMGIYVNNVLVYTVNAATLNTQITLPPGPQHTVVEEWDYCGGATYTTDDLTVTGVLVKSPVPGTNVNSPITYSATAASGCPKGVAAMGIYVNNALVYVVNGAVLNMPLNLAPGPEHTVVEEWDYCGGAAYTTDDLIVGNPNAPVVSVTATPASITLGSLSALKVTATNAAQLSITASDGTSYSLPPAGGTITITPAASTTYWVKATNGSINATGSALVAVTPPSLIDYPRYKGDVGGTGANTNEVLLTPATVNSLHFGQQWSLQVDGFISAQPLYVHGLAINGAAHNVVFVATNNDSLYAVDANTGKQLWMRSFLSTGVTPVNLSSFGVETYGILGTPVIDTATKTMFVSVWTAENSNTYFPHRLHAIDITTGADKLTPVIMTDPVMAPFLQLQRPALLLANGTVYAAFGSVGDMLPYHGLLLAYHETTLAQKARWNVTPDGPAGGIWMSGAAPTADSQGNIYVSVANGYFDGKNNFGESAVKLTPALSVLDYFTPFDYNYLNTWDVDLGSGSAVVVPDQPGPYAHELIVCGKTSPIYVLNRDNMGKLGSASDNIIQRFDNAIGNSGNFQDSGQPCFNSPAVWNNNVYFAANHDLLKMFTISPTTGQLAWSSSSSTTYLYPGANPVVSANGNKNGIVWTVEKSTATLHANDAADVSKSLYVGPSMGTVFRWVPPTVANGYVYVAAFDSLVAYTNY